MGFVSQSVPPKRRKGLGGALPGTSDREQRFARGWLRSVHRASVSEDEARRLLEGDGSALDWSPVDEAMERRLLPVLAWGWSGGLVDGFAQVPSRFAKDVSDALKQRIGGVGPNSPLARRKAVEQLANVSLRASEQTNRGVQTVLRKMVEGTYSPDQARQVLVRNVHLGLNDRYQNAVNNRLSSLQRDLAKNNPGWSSNTVESRARAQAERYAAKLRQAQAEMVSRTEVMKAINGGRAEAWELALMADELPPSAQKQFMTHGAVDFCDDYDGMRVPVQGSFPSGDPPLHPMCRCEVILVVD